MSAIELQPAPPGRFNGLMAPLIAIVVPGCVGPSWLVNVPAALREERIERIVEIGIVVAYGVPRVSTERPRLDWNVFTKERSSPRRDFSSRRVSTPITFYPPSPRPPNPPTMLPRYLPPPPPS